MKGSMDLGRDVRNWALAVIAQSLGEASLLDPEQREVDVHRRDRRRLCNNRKVDLLSG